MFDGRFHVYGGFGVSGTVRPDDVGSDLWRYSDRWELIEDRGPIAARYPSLCAGEENLWLFGGCGWHSKLRVWFSNQLWRRRGERWEKIPFGTPAPSGRYTSLMASGPRGICVFGGHSQDGQGGKTFYDDLWVFDPYEGRWEEVHGAEKGPGRRYGFGWTVAQDAAWLYGGFDGERDRGDLWKLDLFRLDWELVAAEDVRGPLPRYCSALGMVHKGLLLFGGRSKIRPRENFADTWCFGRQGWELLEVGEGPGYHAKSAYASDGHALFLFAGEGPCGHVSDLWKFEASSWERLQECRSDDPILW
jgi:hypothetical protein